MSRLQTAVCTVGRESTSAQGTGVVERLYRTATCCLGALGQESLNLLNYFANSIMFPSWHPSCSKTVSARNRQSRNGSETEKGDRNMARLGKGLVIGVGFAVMGLLGLGAQHASALPNFQANECNVPGTAPGDAGIPIGTCFITADRFNHQFVSSGTQTFGGPDLTGADDPFTETGSARVTGIQLGAGVGASNLITAVLGAPASDY